MKSLQIITSAIALAAMAMPAYAQEFTGPSVGVQGGWNKTDVRNPQSELGPLALEGSKDAFVGGAFIAYDYEVVPNVVIGAQADFSIGANDEIEYLTSVGSVTLDPKRSIDLTARAGYVILPGTLLYARGGYTNARVRTTMTVGGTTSSGSEDRDGWTVGGGVERYVWKNVSARVEYRYADLSDGDGKFDRHQVLLGIGYRF
ncbi:outer membrane protein [Sphingomonas canadensis]|uniref:Outer membrane protein n=1 Tax=Sphingomonas canadensis TaxID=1219257 RepID=A0ABW3HGT8_9SPHN|nr:porin family protein [Sphingomonas canadensis]MCW3838144.1 porin family protein [Sphingomonas canadensis]